MSLESALPGGVFCRAELSAQTVGWGGSEFAVRKTICGAEKQVEKVQEAEGWAAKKTKLKLVMSQEGELGKLPVTSSSVVTFC